MSQINDILKDDSLVKELDALNKEDYQRLEKMVDWIKDYCERHQILNLIIGHNFNEATLSIKEVLDIIKDKAFKWSGFKHV